MIDKLASPSALLSDDQLEHSGIVANCRMNRERQLTGSNGYGRELGFEPLEFLKEVVVTSRKARWLDLCCGSGSALIEAAQVIPKEGLAEKIEIIGVDLVGMFAHSKSRFSSLRLIEASLTHWQPDREFDLITCVHGLHYIGDKLGLIARASSWLTKSGCFVANLGLENFKLIDGRPAGRLVATEVRRRGLNYDSRRKRVTCVGRKNFDFRFRYLGANDQAGPNYTGQSAVDSIYELLA